MVRSGIIFLLITAFLILLTGCGDPEIWGLPQDEVERSIAMKDFSWLDSVDDVAFEPSEVRRLPADAGFFLAKQFLERGYPDRFGALLRFEIADSESGVRNWAFETLCGHLAREGQTESLGTLIEAWPDLVDRTILTQYILALDTAGDAPILTDLCRAKGLGFGCEADAALLRACALADPDHFPAVLERYFSLYRAEDGLAAVYPFLSAENLIASLQKPLRELVYWKVDLYYGSFSAAVDRLEQGLTPLFSRANIEDAYRGFASSGLISRGVAWFDTRLETANSSERYHLLEFRGKLNRGRYRYLQAYEDFSAALAAAPDAVQEERMRWYKLLCTVKSAHFDTLAELEALAPVWRDPAFYDDLLEEYCAVLMGAHDWEGVIEAARIVITYGSADSADQYAWVAARLIEEGLVTDTDLNPFELYAAIIERGQYDYYRLLALARHDRAAALFETRAAASPDSSAVDRMAASDDPDSSFAASASGESDAEILPVPISETDRMAAGLFAYGLDREAAAFALSNRHAIGPENAREAALFFLEEGRPLEALRVFSPVWYDPAFIPAEGDFALFYPRPFETVVEKIAEEQALPAPILWSLIREESHFEHEIVSAAGAVGLTQLMPSTAEDIAGRLKLDNPDLRDPEQNLLLGGWYLAHLRGRLNNYMETLAAYNAGITRVRRWRAGNAALPPDLLLEAVPYAETRNYGRKVLVSACAYAWLGEDATPDELVTLLYPGYPGGKIATLYWSSS